MTEPPGRRDWWTLAELLEPWWQLLAQARADRGHAGAPQPEAGQQPPQDPHR